MARVIKYETARRNIPFGLEPTKETINALNAYIRWAEEEVPQKLRYYMNELVFYMALINQGEARKMSAGPYDPRMLMPSAAWKIPVRRISGRYYSGWKVRQLKPAVWQLYNDSHEAYFIEFGIHSWGATGRGGSPGGNPRRVRRPIRKLSLRRTLDYLASTQVYTRIWATIYTTQYHTPGFSQVVQAPGRWTDISPREAQSVVASGTRNFGRAVTGARRSGIRFNKTRGTYQRYRSGGGDYNGPMLGRTLP